MPRQAAADAEVAALELRHRRRRDVHGGLEARAGCAAAGTAHSSTSAASTARSFAPQASSVPRSGCAGCARIHAQQPVVQAAGMHVEVQVRHLLIGGRSDRVPHAHAFVGKRVAHRARHSGHAGHERGGGDLVGVSHVGHVRARHHQHVARMELAQIEECDGQRVAGHDRGRRSRGDDVTEGAGSRVPERPWTTIGARYSELVKRRYFIGAGALAGAGAWAGLSQSWAARFIRGRFEEFGRDVPAAPHRPSPGELERQRDHAGVARTRHRPDQFLRRAHPDRSGVLPAHRRGPGRGLARSAAPGPMRALARRASRDRRRAGLARALRSPRHAVARRGARPAGGGDGHGHLGPAAASGLLGGPRAGVGTLADDHDAPRRSGRAAPSR